MRNRATAMIVMLTGVGMSVRTREQTNATGRTVTVLLNNAIVPSPVLGMATLTAGRMFDPAGAHIDWRSGPPTGKASDSCRTIVVTIAGNIRPWTICSRLGVRLGL
jgi:hypothetical protein